MVRVQPAVLEQNPVPYHLFKQGNKAGAAYAGRFFSADGLISCFFAVHGETFYGAGDRPQARSDAAPFETGARARRCCRKPLAVSERHFTVRSEIDEKRESLLFVKSRRQYPCRDVAAD